MTPPDLVAGEGGAHRGPDEGARGGQTAADDDEAGVEHGAHGRDAVAEPGADLLEELDAGEVSPFGQLGDVGALEP